MNTNTNDVMQILRSYANYETKTVQRDVSLQYGNFCSITSFHYKTL